MSLWETAIGRPVATTLLTLAITLAGLLSFRLLPVAPLPQIEFPTITVSAGLPGASPEVMAATVATPLERTLGRIAGVTEMTSRSAQGNARITLQFELDRPVEAAARDVQAAINAARASLPSSLPSHPTLRKVNPADAPMMVMSLTSDTLPRGKLFDIASSVLAQRVSQIEGVGEVTVGGSALPALRVRVKPGALHGAGLSMEAVRTSIAAANANLPKGAVEADGRVWQVEANDQTRRAADYLPLVLAWRNGAALRLGDVAEVSESVQDVRNVGLNNGKPAVLMFITRRPNANMVEAVERIRAIMPALQAMVPAQANLQVDSDATRTLRTSLHDVELSLAASVALVILVVFLFLRNGRATLIPAVAVPVSLVASFAVMYLLGFSLNNLSLMALTVATGFVVDDAVVVVENIGRHLERGEAPLRAALLGVREVGFTVVAISLSLIAVFVPILFMGGIVGRMFHEFAVTLSAAVLVSMLVSLTTAPMLAARVLRPEAPAGAGWKRWLERGQIALQRGYAASLDAALRHTRLVMLLLAATIGLNVYLFGVVPKGLFPQQDTGRLFGVLRADQSISFEALRAKTFEAAELLRLDPAVFSVSAFGGGNAFGSQNSLTVLVNLKPQNARRDTAEQVLGRLRSKLSRMAGVQLLLVPVQDFRMGGMRSSGQYQFTLVADDLNELRTWAPRVRDALKGIPELVDVSSDAEDRGLQTRLTYDRDAMAQLGLNVRDTNQLLYDAFGQRQVATLYESLNQYKVVLEYAPEYLREPSALEQVRLPGRDGAMVPLSQVATVSGGNLPLSIAHSGPFVSTTVSFNTQPGVTLSQAMSLIERTVDALGAPKSVRAIYQGSARAFQASMSSQPWLILGALLAMYIVLGVLYESYIHPVTILSTLPSAGVGALLALLAMDTEFSLIAMIGVLLLIGIVKKNAIMMIDFALVAERERGLTPHDAIREACLLRLRPILMTTLAAIFGAIPLAAGLGEGAEMRQPLGITIIGGLLVSQVLTLYTTPVMYLYLDRFSRACGRARARVFGAAPEVSCP